MMSLKEENTTDNFDPNQTQSSGLGSSMQPNDAENNNTPGIEKLAQLVFQQLAQTQSGAQNQGKAFTSSFMFKALILIQKNGMYNK